MSRYIDPTTDFGFKKIFGEEANKDITLSLVNTVLGLESPLRDLSYSNIERLPETAEERKGYYDLYCEDAAGNHYLVEMQKNRLAFIKDRTLYYSTFPIVAQARKGKSKSNGKSYSYPRPSAGGMLVREAPEVYEDEEVVAINWDYELKAVYCIAILGYALNGSQRAVNRNSLRNDEPPHEPFYDKLKFVTVELPLFDEHKPEYSLERPLNQWLYFLKYLPMLYSLPAFLAKDPVFRKAARIAELARLTAEERRDYAINRKYMRDNYAMLTTSYNQGKDEGKIEGRTEGKIETLLMLLSEKLGPVPSDIDAAVRALKGESQLDALLKRIAGITDWETLRALLH